MYIGATYFCVGMSNMYLIHSVVGQRVTDELLIIALGVSLNKAHFIIIFTAPLFVSFLMLSRLLL